MKTISFIKKTIYGLALLLSAVGAASCSDFLDKNPYDRADPQSDITDEIAVAMANACYVPLRSSNLYNQRIWGLDIVAGNSNVGAGGGDDGIETIQAANFTTLTDNGMALYMWRSPWIGIAQCNNLIAALASQNSCSEGIARRSEGEALFLRAHYYYILARLFGGVPLRLEPYDPDTSSAIARTTLEETYEQIIKDCTRAAELLPEKADYDSHQVGRACKDAALYMLADIYLTLAPRNSEYYQDVVDICDEITSLGYALDTPYADNFNCPVRNGAESIFEVQYSGSTESDFWGNTPYASWLSAFMGPRGSNMVAGSWGWNQPTQEFVEAYEEGDLRKDITIFYDGCPDWEGIPYRSSYSNTGYNVRKFLVSKTISPETNTSPANFVVYRYAGVLLMQAEALNELGMTSSAAAPLNQVRKRAGLANVSGSISKDAMRETIIHERRMELAFEGHRWFDMIRINGGSYAVDFLKSIGKNNVTVERLLFPIPQTEMDANPLMQQNPGY
ncbi:MAG: RagB/SusD family nutrient uptake outer membrane protein [Bacteroides sp.]|nr:RagB/SusD family nutrient uptake outer membrane protein [Bacteroides sp.]